MVHTRLNRNLFPSQNPMAPTKIPRPTHSALMNCVTPESLKRSTTSSSRSYCLRSGALGGCNNCVILEGILDAERKARFNAMEALPWKHVTSAWTQGPCYTRLVSTSNKPTNSSVPSKALLKQQLIIVLEVLTSQKPHLRSSVLINRWLHLQDPIHYPLESS